MYLQYHTDTTLTGHGRQITKAAAAHNRAYLFATHLSLPSFRRQFVTSHRRVPFKREPVATSSLYLCLPFFVLLSLSLLLSCPAALLFSSSFPMTGASSSSSSSSYGLARRGEGRERGSHTPGEAEPSGPTIVFFSFPAFSSSSSSAS